MYYSMKTDEPNNMKQIDQGEAIKITPEESRLKIRGLNSSTPEIAIKKSDEPLGVNETNELVSNECWLCNEELQDTDIVGFCDEFDTYYHDKCVNTIPVSAHYDCPVCAMEMDEMVVSFKTDLEEIIEDNTL